MYLQILNVIPQIQHDALANHSANYLSELILQEEKAESEQQVVIAKGQKLGQIVCVPSMEMMRAGKENAAKLFSSHEWIIQEIKSYGTGGVLLKYSCSKCDAEGFATFVNRGY
ncbi:MAG: hypothetical protein ACREBS_04840 [Nitrososphaerales archaeon]